MASIGHATGFEIFLISPDTEDLAAVGHHAGQSPVHLTSRNQAVVMGMLDAQAGFLRSHRFGRGRRGFPIAVC